MNTVDNGGPAFPMTDQAVQDWSRGGLPMNQTLGMSLRDYFAAKAMPRAWAALIESLNGATLEDTTSVYEVVSQCAYEMADAMLKARSQ